MKNFTDKVVVVTGAASGMGRAYAFEFGKLGAKLALNDRDEAGLQTLKKELASQGVENVLIANFDVSDRLEMLSFAGDVKSTFGNAHVIINNAGIEGSTLPFMETTSEDFERIMGINFNGVLHGCQAFLPQLIQNGEGAVVNVSSIFGLIGTPRNTDYCASKFAVRGLTEAMMVEFHDSPIQIHCLHPGGIATNIVKNPNGKKFSEKFLITPPEEIVKYVIKSIKNNRLKIVYGEGSFPAWFGANFVPLKMLKAIIWGQMKKVLPTKVNS